MCCTCKHVRCLAREQVEEGANHETPLLHESCCMFLFGTMKGCGVNGKPPFFTALAKTLHVVMCEWQNVSLCVWEGVYGLNELEKKSMRHFVKCQLRYVYTLYI